MNPVTLKLNVQCANTFASLLVLQCLCHFFSTCREKLSEEFNKQIKSVFTQWDADLTKAKEQEDKLQV